MEIPKTVLLYVDKEMTILGEGLKSRLSEMGYIVECINYIFEFKNIKNKKPGYFILGDNRSFSFWQFLNKGIKPETSIILADELAFFDANEFKKKAGAILHIFSSAEKIDLVMNLLPGYFLFDKSIKLFNPVKHILTDRENEVLKLLATNPGTLKEIGLEIGLKEKTMEVHRLNISNKLGLHSRFEIIRWYLEHETFL